MKELNHAEMEVVPKTFAIQIKSLCQDLNWMFIKQLKQSVSPARTLKTS